MSTDKEFSHTSVAITWGYTTSTPDWDGNFHYEVDVGELSE